jgi:hypothetical protein
VVEVGKHVPGEQVGFGGGVRIAGQDEGVHAEVGVGADLGEHLIGVADDGRAGAGVGPADAGPQVRFGVALIAGRVAQFVLPPGSRGAGVQGPAADRILSPVRSSSRETRRCAAARASASVARTMTWAR